MGYVKKILGALFVALLALALPARAQFTGYVGLQTTTTPSVNLLNGANCASGITSAPIANIGQTVHFISYDLVFTGTQPQISIIGSIDNVFYFPVSDVAMPANNVQGTLVGYGAVNYIKVQVSSGATTCDITASYSGAQVTPPVTTGSVDAAIYQKQVFTGTSAGSAANTGLFAPPYGNTAGVLVVQTTGALPSGSTIGVYVQPPVGVTIAQVATFTVSGATGQQTFVVPSVAGSQVEVVYTSGGSSSQNFSAAYEFFKPGASQSPQCEQTAIINTAAAGPTQEIAALNSTSIRVCSVNVSSATAEAIDFQQGTGTNCGTGNSQATGLSHLGASLPWIQSFPSGGLVLAPGNALCIHLSAGNQTDGTITYSHY